MVSVPDGPVGRGDTLRVLHAPGYAPAMDGRIIERAEGTGADVINYTEAYAVAGVPLHNRPGYRTKVGRSDVDTRGVRSPMGDAGDNPICVRSDLRQARRKAFRVTHPGPLGHLFKFTPERWLTVVTFEWNGLVVTNVNAHPSPFFAGPVKWRRVMAAALREVHAAKARGEAVVLTGDLQRGAGSPVAKMLTGAGLRTWCQGVGWVAWSGLEILSREIFSVQSLDHAWMLGEFRAAS